MKSIEKKFSNTVVIEFDHYDMCGSGINSIKYTRDDKGRFLNEEVSLEDFINDLQIELFDVVGMNAYDVGFYFSYDSSICIDYDSDIVSDKNVDVINNFLFYSNITLKV